MCSIVSTVLTAKAKFKAMLDNKFYKSLDGIDADMISKKRDHHECMKIIEKCMVFKEMHQNAKNSMFDKMVFHRLSKG